MIKLQKMVSRRGVGMKEELYMMLFKKKRDDEIKGILKCNEISREYGLELSEEEVEILVKKRYEVLRELKRRDYGNWVIDQIIKEFCKSEFITKDNYAQTVGELMYRFYYYKNETKNLVPYGCIRIHQRSDKAIRCFRDPSQQTNDCGDLSSLM